VSNPASGEPPERVGGHEGTPRTDPDGPAEGVASGLPTGEPATTTSAEASKLPHTRTALAFKSLLAGAVVLILLLVFILENTESVKISYFGAGFHLPLGVALLLAAIGGALLMGILGTARIVQLRRRVRRPH
jgi:uncharacterized integral membrane protein